MRPSTSHLVVIPSYNTGPILVETVRQAMAQWSPVWLFIDGSDDNAHRLFLDNPENWPALRVLVSEKNRGKGATAFLAAEEAAREGYSHLLLMDADGQHPTELIVPFMQASLENPDAMILGQPVFGSDAPWVRLAGRQLSVGMVWLETCGGGAGDPLMGFRVYPVRPLVEVAKETRYARRYDFDPEVLVRLFWRGVRPLCLPAPVRYLPRAEGGVSHFHYLRDNLFMIALHLRLVLGFIPRCLRVARLSHRWRQHKGTSVNLP